MSMEESSPMATNTSSDECVVSSEAPSEHSKKRKLTKPFKPRSKAWNHFKKVTSDNGQAKCICVHCGRPFSCDTKKNGTAALNYHIKHCIENLDNVDKSQSQIVLSNKGQDGEGSMSTWKFDQELVRNKLGNMIVKCELPFRFVEEEGFQEFLDAACPRFHIPSRTTITRDIYQLYLDERVKMRQFLKISCTRVCLTTDTCTSLQRTNYMCLTAHFIDDNWNLHHKILNFCEILSHKGEAIGKMIEKCLLSWGIDKLFTVTVDNATANDVASAYLQKKFGSKPGNILNGKYMHMRCVAHIVNLIVHEGLKLLNTSVARVREAVRFVRQSPQRFQKFKDCVESENIDSKSLLCQDCPARWNSIYLMLNCAQKFEKAFYLFDLQDENYKVDLESGYGIPTESDWKIVREVVKFSEHIYELTLRVLGTSYVTSNCLFDEICEIDCLLRECKASNENDFSFMALKMKDKFQKYWGNFDKLNMLIFVAIILDPRHKFNYVEFALKEMFEGSKGVEMVRKVKEAVYELYNAYKPPQENISSISTPTSSSEIGDCRGRMRKRMQEKYVKHKIQSGSIGEQMSELDKYLNETTEPMKVDFNILLWWKVNSLRFPHLSLLARDVLAIPISTVASESTFNTGGRVLDSFRSRLTAKMAQALVCYQDWIRKSKHAIDLSKEVEDLIDYESVGNDSYFTAKEPTI